MVVTKIIEGWPNFPQNSIFPNFPPLNMGNVLHFLILCPKMGRREVTGGGCDVTGGRPLCGVVPSLNYRCAFSISNQLGHLINYSY